VTTVNPCTAETVTATDPSNGLYYLSNPTPLSLDFSTYFNNSDNPSCERIYGIYSNLACTHPANTTLFNFDTSTAILSILQSDPTLYGNYTLYVKVTMFTNTAATAVSTY